MKLLTKTILLLLSITPAVALSQLVVTGTANPFFDTFNKDMSKSVSHLYATTNPDSRYSEIIYTTDVDPFDPFSVGEGKFITNAVNPQFSPADTSLLGTTMFFEEIENYSAFDFSGALNVGFFGNESWDKNKLSATFTELFGGTITQSIDPLFLYDKTGETPASSIELFAGNEIRAVFSHTDITFGNKYATQENSGKFRMFQLVDREFGTKQNSFIFTIDDRMDTLVDHDDGFFFVEFESSVTPVPEPSAIALLSVAGLLGIILIRRKIRQKK